MKFSDRFLLFIGVLICAMSLIKIERNIKDNTAAIREQTKAVSGFNLIQAPERIAEIVLYQQEKEDVLKEK